MTQENKIPTSLSVVSYFFLFMGIMSANEFLGGLTRGEFIFDFGILGFWVFFGLRRYSPGSRTCALVFVWLASIGLVIAFVYGLLGSGPASIEIFGKRYADIPVIWLSIVSAIFLPLEIWKYRVLTRPNIRSMFYEESQLPMAS